jgi:hypothetical protein
MLHRDIRLIVNLLGVGLTLLTVAWALVRLG